MTALNTDTAARVQSLIMSVADVRYSLARLASGGAEVTIGLPGRRRNLEMVFGADGDTEGQSDVLTVALKQLRRRLRSYVEELASMGVTLQPGEHDYGPGYPAPTFQFNRA